MAAIQTIGIPQQPVVSTKQYGAGIVTDPRLLAIASIPNATYKSAIGTVSSINVAAPSGFVEVNFNGLTTRTNLVSIAGSGILAHVFTAAASSDTPIIYITVDGVLYKITPSASVSGLYRLSLGSLIIGANVLTATTATYSSDHLHTIGGSEDQGHTTRATKYQLVANHPVIPSIMQLCNMGLPRLRFEKSLSIDIQHAVAPAASSRADYAMCNYQLD